MRRAPLLAISDFPIKRAFESIGFFSCFPFGFPLVSSSRLAPFVVEWGWQVRRSIERVVEIFYRFSATLGEGRGAQSRGAQAPAGAVSFAVTEGRHATSKIPCKTSTGQYLKGVAGRATL